MIIIFFNYYFELICIEKSRFGLKGVTVERAMIWFICAAMHDPVRPVIKNPATIGWEAKERQVDLVIDRPFKGEELLIRMKGWVTVDVYRVAEIVQQHGQLKMLDDYHLVVETDDMAGLRALSEALVENFDQAVWIEHMEKQLLK